MEQFEYPLRSIEQHNSEWLYYQMIANGTGHTAYEVYEIIAAELLKVICDDGEIGYIKPATLNSFDHNQYMERIRVFMAEFGVILPDPDKKIKLNHQTKKSKYGRI